MLDLSSWVTKICGRSCRHCLAMERTKGFFTEKGMLVGMDVSEVALLTRDEVEEFVLVVWRIEKKGVEVESQSEERWVFSDKSSPSLYLS